MQSVNARELIQAALISELKQRAVRSALMFLATLILLVAYFSVAGFTSNVSLPIAGFGINAFVLMTVSYAASCSTSSRDFGDGVYVWSCFAAVLPLMECEHLGPSTSVAAALKCGFAVALLGAATLLGLRLGLGRLRRRFGRAPVLRAVAAALVAVLAIGLSCPLNDALHLLSHIAGGALISVGCSRLLA